MTYFNNTSRTAGILWTKHHWSQILFHFNTLLTGPRHISNNKSLIKDIVYFNTSQTNHRFTLFKTQQFKNIYHISDIIHHKPDNNNSNNAPHVKIVQTIISPFRNNAHNTPPPSKDNSNSTLLTREIFQIDVSSLRREAK